MATNFFVVLISTDYSIGTSQLEMLLDLVLQTAVFSFLSKKYLYVDICPSDGTHNHLTYLRKIEVYGTRMPCFNL